jgi:hypothetical protein
MVFLRIVDAERQMALDTGYRALIEQRLRYVPEFYVHVGYQRVVHNPANSHVSIFRHVKEVSRDSG